MIASKYKTNHYACLSPEIRKIMSKSGSWINNHLFTYTPYIHVNWQFTYLLTYLLTYRWVLPGRDRRKAADRRGCSDCYLPARFSFRSILFVAMFLTTFMQHSKKRLQLSWNFQRRRTIMPSNVSDDSILWWGRGQISLCPTPFVGYIYCFFCCINKINNKNICQHRRHQDPWQSHSDGQE